MLWKLFKGFPPTPQEAAQELESGRRVVGRYLVGMMVVLIGVMVWTLLGKNVSLESVVVLIALIGLFTAMMSLLIFARSTACQLHFTGWTGPEDSN